MAWLDDRFWCHPKITSLSDRAYRSHVNAITYCSGFGTGGVLTTAQQKAVGVTPKARRELVISQLWDENFLGKTAADNGSVRIHDWDGHNGKRDERRAADKERKRAARAKEREERPQDTLRTELRTYQDVSAGQLSDKLSDRRTLKEVKEVTGDGEPENTTDTNPEQVLQAVDLQALPQYEGHEYQLWKRLCVAAGVANKPDGIRKLENTRRAHKSTEREIVMAIEAATGPGVNDELAVALAELKKLGLERKQQTAERKRGAA